MDLLPIGAEIDLLDENDVYCPATVVKHTPFQINYLGWGSTWNETLTPSDFHRIQFPGGKFVKKYKGWVKYHRDIGHWPSLVYIRQPKEGSKLGINYLKEEMKVFVQPFGGKKVETLKQMKPYTAGAWMNTANIWSTNTNLVKRWKENGLGGEVSSSYQETFAGALEEMEASDALELSFKFHGSYDLSQVKRGRKSASASAASLTLPSGSGTDTTSHSSSRLKSSLPLSSTALSSALLAEQKNELRIKTFTVLAADLLPVLQSHLTPPSVRAIQTINEGLIRHHGTMSVPLMEEEIFSLSRFFENALSDQLQKYVGLMTRRATGTETGAEIGTGGGRGSKRRKGSCPQRIEMKRKKSSH
jgi:hypothetical protein